MLHVFMVMILGMNGIAVARNGPILWENDATGSRKVFKWLRGFWEAIKIRKLLQKSGNGKSRKNSRKRKSQNGPRRWENEVTGSRKVFRCLRGFWDAI